MFKFWGTATIAIVATSLSFLAPSPASAQHAPVRTPDSVWHFDYDECDYEDNYDYNDPDCWYKGGLVVAELKDIVSQVHIGVNGGGAFGSSNIFFSDGNTNNFSTSGGLFGVQVGSNWLIQSSPAKFPNLPWKKQRVDFQPQFAIMAGLETDLDFGQVDGSTNTNCFVGCRTRIQAFGTARAILGLASNQFHGITPYLTGGLAYGEVRTSVGVAPTSEEWNAGWTFGGGLQKALSRKLIVKAEYLHADLGHVGCAATTCGPDASNHVTMDVFRAKLDYKIGK
jgi:outer membrane immunogenic protein